MKKRQVLILVFFIATTAFTVIKTLDTINDTRKKILHGYLILQYDRDSEEALNYPDTSILFNNPNDGMKDANNKFTLKSLNQSGLLWARNLGSAISSDFYHHNDEFDKIFIQQFGKSIFRKPVSMAQNKDGIKPEFIFYSTEGIQAAFNKLYVKPTNKFEEYSYQKIYNLTAKAYLRDFTKFLAYIMSKKSIFIAASNRYLKNAKTSKDFYPWHEMYNSYNELFTTEASKKQFPNFTKEVSNSDLGTLLRRQCDGTLPTLLSCLKTVLKDYDPEALKLIKGTF